MPNYLILILNYFNLSGEIKIKVDEQEFTIKTDVLQVKRYQKTIHGKPLNLFFSFLPI
jgi:hypothetical protein